MLKHETINNILFSYGTNPFLLATHLQYLFWLYGYTYLSCNTSYDVDTMYLEIYHQDYYHPLYQEYMATNQDGYDNIAWDILDIILFSKK